MSKNNTLPLSRHVFALPVRRYMLHQKKWKTYSLSTMTDTSKARDSPLPSPKQSRWFYWPATGDFTKRSDEAVQHKTSTVATNSDVDTTSFSEYLNSCDPVLQHYPVTRAHVLLYCTNYIFKEEHRPRNALTLTANKVTVDIDRQNLGEAEKCSRLEERSQEFISSPID